MRSRLVTVLGNTRLCGFDKNRKVLIISSSVANGLDISDEGLSGNDTSAMMLPPFNGSTEQARPTLILLKSENDRTEKAWFGFSAISGSVYVFEGF